jgi:cell division protein FtsL
MTKTEMEEKGFKLLKTSHIIISLAIILIAMGVLWGTTTARLSTAEEKIETIYKLQLQMNRFEFNLRRLIEKNGMKYEDFGN